MVGVYHGATKPDSLKDYLHNFLIDLKKVVKEGFTFENKFFKINLPDAFSICDTLARSFLKCVKGHGGYYGCERCIQKGQYYKNRIIYPETEAPLRNDTHFMDQYDRNHQNDISPFQELGIGLVSQFILDYMHLVCLGVVKRLINLWMPMRGSCLLSIQIASAISKNLVFLKKLMPSEFSRKPRSLFELRLWKATEFRAFLLYTGPVVLKDKISPPMYKNFLYLSISIRILLKNDSSTAGLSKLFVLVTHFLNSNIESRHILNTI